MLDKLPLRVKYQERTNLHFFPFCKYLFHVLDTATLVLSASPPLLPPTPPPPPPAPMVLPSPSLIRLTRSCPQSCAQPFLGDCSLSRSTRRVIEMRGTGTALGLILLLPQSLEPALGGQGGGGEGRKRKGRWEGGGCWGGGGRIEGGS